MNFNPTIYKGKILLGVDSLNVNHVMFSNQTVVIKGWQRVAEITEWAIDVITNQFETIRLIIEY